MSGTRKMGKYEGGPGGPPITDLPARPFEPRTTPLDAGDTAPATVVSAATAAAITADLPPSHEPPQHWGGEWVPPQAPLAPGGPEDVQALRTGLARKFVSLSDSVTESFREFAIGGGAWAVELTAPQGMSTGGGRQALQHLRLMPRRSGYSILVVGTVNPMERRAELRDWDHLMVMHEVRFRHTLEISSQEWEQFLRKAEVVLNAAGIQSMRTPPPRDLLEQRRSLKRVSRGAVIAFVVVLILAAVVVWRVIVTLLRS